MQIASTSRDRTRPLIERFGKVLGIATGLMVFVLSAFSGVALSQSAANPARTGSFRIGEKLTYSVSFESLKNAAFFETQVISSGKMAGKDVVEIRGRLKTFELVSAAIKLVDETRTVFADPDTGSPVYITRKLKDGPLPKEISNDFLTSPSGGFDLLTLLFRIRETGGTGNFLLMENNEVSSLTSASAGTEKVKTFAGEFETNVVNINGAYFDTIGIKKLTINLSNDDKRIPVLIRIRTEKGDYRAELSSIQDTPPPAPKPTPTPVPTTPKPPTPSFTPKPVPTSTPYVPNRPLLPELSFSLGETLDYAVTNAGNPIGRIRMAVKERTLFGKRDSLTLTATVTGVEKGNDAFTAGDSIVAKVDPDQLVPFQSDMKFGGSLAAFSQTALFDRSTGAIMFGGANSTDAPIGTHTLLSLLYAMRSFNLRPSKDLSNPVNDTRVAVFWKDKPYIFTLRPMTAETIKIDGAAVGAQQINIITGNPDLDRMGFKVWLSTDERRVPLRVSIGKFQADLTSVSHNQPS